MRKVSGMSVSLLFLLILIGQTVGLTALFFVADARAATTCTSLPALKTSVQIPVNGEYALWLHAKTNSDSRPSAVYGYFDAETTCTNFNVPEPSGALQWVSGQSTVLKKTLSAGMHTLSIAVEGGSLDADKVLVTGNTSCTPVDTGTNCLDQDVRIEVVGLTGGEPIKDSLTVTTKITGAKLQAPKVEYYFDSDSTPYTTRVAEPYCLHSDGTVCGALDVSFLSTGTHKLKVIIYADNLQPVTHLIPFNKVAGNTSVPITPVPTVVTPTPVKATTAVVSTPKKSNTVVVGATTQPVTKTVTGTTVATVTPSIPLASGDKVTYKVNGTEYGSQVVADGASDPSTTLDVSDQPSGESTISADIERADGSVESYTTKATIDNSTSAQTKSWFGRGGFKFITSLFGIMAGGAALFFLVRYIKQRREYEFAHNMNNYEYVQPESNVAAYSLPPVAIMLFAAGAVFSAFTSAESARVGTLADLTKALLPAEYSLVAVDGVNVVHMKYLASDATPPRIVDDSGIAPTAPPATPPRIVDDSSMVPSTPPVTPPITPTIPTNPQLALSSPPFSPSSLWNSQISSAQQSKWFDIPLLHYNSVMNESRKWFLSNKQLRVWHGTATDPVWTVTMPQFGNENQTFNRNWPPSTFTIHAPQNIQEGTDGDHILAIIDHVTGEYFENWSKVVIDATNHTIVGPQGAGWARGNAVNGTGFGVPLAQGGNSAGVRAANFSWIGGAITGYDIQQILDGKKTDFGHAFVVALGYDTLSKWGLTTPATAPDNGDHDGPIKMGTRIGIPAGVSMPPQIDPSDKIGVAYFNTLQRYGAFVGDFAGGQWPIVYVDGNSVKEGSAYELALNNAWIWWNQEGVIDPAKTANQFCVPLLRLMENN